MSETESNEILSTPKKLSPKHQAFIESYFRLGMNATAAYQEVHPKVTYESARALSSALLTNINIRHEIDKRLSEQVMTSNEVLKRLSDMAKANLLPFIKITDEGFTYFDFSHPDSKNYFHFIKKIKTKRTRRIEGSGKSAEVWEDEWVEVELHDAQSALEKIGKYHGLFIERFHEVSDAELNAQIERELARVADKPKEAVSGKTEDAGK
jgi:hypothetical protein